MHREGYFFGGDGQEEEQPADYGKQKGGFLTAVQLAMDGSTIWSTGGAHF